MKYLKFITALLFVLNCILCAAEKNAAAASSTASSRTMSIFAFFLLLVTVASLELARRFRKQAKTATRKLLEIQQDVLAEEHKIQKLEKSVEASQATAMTKARFLATMSHEIRTPLNAIIGFADFLNRPDLPPEKQREYAQSLNTVANALLSLLNDLLDLAKLESGNTDTINLRQGTTNFTKLLKEMKTVFQLKAGQKGLILSFDVDKEIPCVTALESRIRQILLNVIGNAIKYTIKGAVKVSCHATPGQDEDHLNITIKVSDTGIGISPQGLKRVFDPFAQDIESRQGKVFAGTGLGLAIVKRLVDASGGSVTVDSVLGQGSTFTIVLSNLTICDPSESKDSLSSIALSQKQKIDSVLVVDDIQMNRRILGMYLKSLGISDIVDFASAQEALQYVDAHPVDLIFSDMWMPGMNGIDFAKEMNKRHPDIPIVIVTADIDVESSSFDLSVLYEILTKPITVAKLKKLLAQLLDNS